MSQSRQAAPPACRPTARSDWPAGWAPFWYCSCKGLPQAYRSVPVPCRPRPCPTPPQPSPWCATITSAPSTASVPTPVARAPSTGMRSRRRSAISTARSRSLCRVSPRWRPAAPCTPPCNARSPRWTTPSRRCRRTWPASAPCCNCRSASPPGSATARTAGRCALTPPAAICTPPRPTCWSAASTAWATASTTTARKATPSSCEPVTRPLAAARVWPCCSPR